ncbi:DUF5365 family protein [Bacillus salitolerans]|uniref:DUF5365 family protein n=1 Tax=Bacillus salitolerans TaxID=1437434 RepID=A0ABW4LVN3_9BACI
MKVVVASTPEQEQFISELVDYIYREVFPTYFTDEYIEELQKLDVLIPKTEGLYNGTLKEAFQLISSMQAIIAVIETVSTEDISETHYEIFEKNTSILEEYGYNFPFSIHHFSHPREEKLSCYSKPTSPFVM